jgi:hypothetical protein
MMPKINKRTKDSTLAYYVNQLDNFDQTLHEPLVSVSWGRDIKLRGNVTLANESTSFTRQSFGGAGTQSGFIANQQSIPFISPNSTAIPGVDVNGERLVTPLRPVAREIGFTFIELQRSQLLGQPIDQQQLLALQTMYQMETDSMVYVGSSDVGAEGLVNSSLVTVTSAPNGAGGSPLWANKTPVEILADVNSILQASWAAAGFAVCPSELRLPPAQYSQISTQLVSSAGSVSILKYLAENCIANNINGKPLNIQPLKWLTQRGGSSANRMMVYTNELNYVRFPMVPVQRQTAYYKGIHFLCPYVYGFGEVEFVYPETVRYMDGI